MLRTLFCLVIWTACLAQNTETLYLSGVDKDHTVEWDFFCTQGSNSGFWTKIAVPSNWELQGFGHYNWGRDKVLANEKGLYKYSFVVPPAWKNKTVFVVFEASMTDTEVKINGRSAGPIHQGGFYRFRYNVTSLLRFGAQNLLEATVSKMSGNNSVNEAERTADYWVFGGIFRPVYLQAFPREYIDRVAIDAHRDGSFQCDVFCATHTADAQITLQLEQNGQLLPQSWTAAASESCIKGNLRQPALWSPEVPHLYTAIISLQKNGQTLHRIMQKFGFRTIEIRKQDGIYLNDKKIMFRGVCRHCFWPESGRCLSKEISLADVQLIKDMNMNAVRMTHYPPDTHFLDACDSLGLLVIDELAGWQYPPYDTEIGKKLVPELVCRDVNHPCIVLWANGNEGGFNYDLLPEYDKYDPQHRTVIHPWETIHGLNTFHYFPYDYGIQSVFHGQDIFFPTEILHGMYDGGLGAGLDDYWNLMLDHPLSAGAFLWVLTDEGVLRRDRSDSMDTRGNMGPDGIVGPFREKEGSYYTIKDIWSPIQFAKKIITPRFDGCFRISNRFLETNVKQCRFTGAWIRYDGVFPNCTRQIVEQAISSPDIEAQASGKLTVSLPSNWPHYDVLHITAVDPDGRNINHWAWNLSSAETWSRKNLPACSTPVTAKEDGKTITLATDALSITFDKKSGKLVNLEKSGIVIPLGHGPTFVGFESPVQNLKLVRSDSGYSVHWIFSERPECHMQWSLFDNGQCCLEYDYRPLTGAYDLLGITFSFPESLVTGAKLLANGPYRVWKNRLRGPIFDLYHKQYNNTVTGESWDYPEFKGYYSNFYGVALQTKQYSFSILSASDDLFLHLFTPDAPKGAANNQTMPLFPEGDLSFLHTITAIGNKGHTAELTGPQGGKSRFQPNRNTKNLSGKLYFIF